MKSLSAELVAIIATGVALASLLLIGQHRLEDRLLADQHRMEDRLLAGQHRLEDRLLAVEKEQARISALLEGAGLTTLTRDSAPVQDLIEPNGPDSGARPTVTE